MSFIFSPFHFPVLCIKSYVCSYCAGAPEAETEGDPEAEKGGGLVAEPGPGGPVLVAPARAGKMKSEASKKWNET